MSQTSTDRIEKEIELNAPIARVWRAITDHREFGTWFRVNLESPFAVGEKTRGQITYPGYEHLTFEITVEAMDTERLFSYRWKPTASDPNRDTANDPPTLVEFKLEANGAKTRLSLTESGFDALPAELREECFRRNDGGWTAQVKNIADHVTAKA